MSKTYDAAGAALKINGKTVDAMDFKTDHPSPTFSMMRSMIMMQCALNDVIGPDWRTNPPPFYRAAWMELAEAMDHWGWKWWRKTNEQNREMFIGEAIDYWHFAISTVLAPTVQTYPVPEDNDDAAEVLTWYADQFLTGESCTRSEAQERNLNEEVLRCVELLACKTNLQRHFLGGAVALFFRLMTLLDLTMEDLYLRYLCKNLLNMFRQDFGYKTGRYEKDWTFTAKQQEAGQQIETVTFEDNEVLDTIREILTDASIEVTEYDTPMTIYMALAETYRSRASVRYSPDSEWAANGLNEYPTLSVFGKAVADGLPNHTGEVGAVAYSLKKDGLETLPMPIFLLNHDAVLVPEGED